MLPQLVSCLRDRIHEMLTGPPKPPVWSLQVQPVTRTELLGSFLFYYVALLAPLYFTVFKDVLRRLNDIKLKMRRPDERRDANDEVD